jgi:membrane protease YdiL (CAAX protease family)
LRRRPLVALAATIGLLIAWNLLRSAYVPGRYHLVISFTLAFVFAAIGLAGGLDRAGLGLSGARVRSGLIYGGAVLGVILVGLLIVRFVPFTSGLMNDDQADVSGWTMLFETLVVIPFGTVALEEIAFRGTLLGLLRTHLDTVPAVLVSAVFFGLWHINSVIRDNHGQSGAAIAGATIATLIATTIAGVGFAWLRVRSDSLIAPMLAHVATNSLTFAVAWSIVR